MNDWSRLDALLSAAVDQGAVAGVVVAATTASGPIYHRSFGRIGLSDERPINPDTIFWIGSMTKAITSVAALQLVGRGMLSLDEPIADIVPELRDRRILEGFEPDGTARLRPARRSITLKHLLTHTSGFAEDVWHEGIATFVKQAGIPPSATRKRATLDLPLVFEPGTQWQYGISHEWVGVAIERASGQRLDDYVRESVFEPLGMQDSTWEVRDASRLASVCRRDKPGQLTAGSRKLPVAPEFTPGGGGLYSTASDYLAFVRMHLAMGRAHGAEILKPDLAARMAENHTGAIPVGKLSPTMPDMSNPVQFMRGTHCCWGLGFQINLEPLPTGRSAGSLAWAGLGNTYFWIDRDRGVGGVLLTQVLPFADPEVMDLFARFEAAVYDTCS